MIRIKNIVVGTDFGGPAATALEYGRNMARAFDATLHVVHVVDDFAAAPISEVPVDLGPMQAEVNRRASADLEALVSEDKTSLAVTPVVLMSHSAAGALLQHADDVRADLVIVGTHGRGGLAEFFLGSVAQKVVRSAGCPVLTVREHEREFIRPDAMTVEKH